MKKTILSIGLCSLLSTSFAQCGERYFNDIFPAYDTTNNIVFGSNIDLYGDTAILTLDFYEPAGDVELQRPLLIFIHGGFFIGGTKEDSDMVWFCRYFATKGYACASINYRLGVGLDEIDSVGFGKAVIRAVQDAKAAIRYFKVPENASAYRIDTNQIIVGGSSAGGVVALQSGFLTPASPIPDWVLNMIDTIGGGIEGESGNSGPTSTLKGVLSFAGAIVDTSWMVNDNVFVCTTHSKDDDVVPYGVGIIYYIGLQIAPVMGSSVVKEKADKLGIPNAFLSFDTAGHVPHLHGGAELWETEVFLREYIYTQLDCFDGNVPANISTVEYPDILIYPNPAQNGFSILSSYPENKNWNVEIYNVMGQCISSTNLYGSDNLYINTHNLITGRYLVRILSADEMFMKSLIIE